MGHVWCGIDYWNNNFGPNIINNVGHCCFVFARIFFSFYDTGFALAKDNNPPESSGVALGLINTFVVGSGAILQPLVGVLLDYRWTGEMFDGVRVFNLVDFQVSMLILPFVCLISFASAFYIREPQ